MGSSGGGVAGVMVMGSWGHQGASVGSSCCGVSVGSWGHQGESEGSLGHGVSVGSWGSVGAGSGVMGVHGCLWGGGHGVMEVTKGCLLCGGRHVVGCLG